MKRLKVTVALLLFGLATFISAASIKVPRQSNDWIEAQSRDSGSHYTCRHHYSPYHRHYYPVFSPQRGSRFQIRPAMVSAIPVASRVSDTPVDILIETLPTSTETLLDNPVTEEAVPTTTESAVSIAMKTYEQAKKALEMAGKMLEQVMKIEQTTHEATEQEHDVINDKAQGNQEQTQQVADSLPSAEPESGSNPADASQGAETNDNEESQSPVQQSTSSDGSETLVNNGQQEDKTADEPIITEVQVSQSSDDSANANVEVNIEADAVQSSEPVSNDGLQDTDPVQPSEPEANDEAKAEQTPADTQVEPIQPSDDTNQGLDSGNVADNTEDRKVESSDSQSNDGLVEATADNSENKQEEQPSQPSEPENNEEPKVDNTQQEITQENDPNPSVSSPQEEQVTVIKTVESSQNREIVQIPVENLNRGSDFKIVPCDKVQYAAPHVNTFNMGHAQPYPYVHSAGTPHQPPRGHLMAVPAVALQNHGLVSSTAHFSNPSGHVPGRGGYVINTGPRIYYPNAGISSSNPSRGMEQVPIRPETVEIKTGDGSGQGDLNMNQAKDDSSSSVISGADVSISDTPNQEPNLDVSISDSPNQEPNPDVSISDIPNQEPNLEVSDVPATPPSVEGVLDEPSGNDGETSSGEPTTSAPVDIPKDVASDPIDEPVDAPTTEKAPSEDVKDDIPSDQSGMSDPIPVPEQAPEVATTAVPIIVPDVPLELEKVNSELDDPITSDGSESTEPPTGIVSASAEASAKEGESVIAVAVAATESTIAEPENLERDAVEGEKSIPPTTEAPVASAEGVDDQPNLDITTNNPVLEEPVPEVPLQASAGSSDVVSSDDSPIPIDQPASDDLPAKSEPVADSSPSLEPVPSVDVAAPADVSVSVSSGTVKQEASVQSAPSTQDKPNIPNGHPYSNVPCPYLASLANGQLAGFSPNYYQNPSRTSYVAPINKLPSLNHYQSSTPLNNQYKATNNRNGHWQTGNSWNSGKPSGVHHSSVDRSSELGGYSYYIRKDGDQTSLVHSIGNHPYSKTSHQSSGLPSNYRSLYI